MICRAHSSPFSGLFSSLLLIVQTFSVNVAQGVKLPAQTVLIDIPGLAVLGDNGVFRTSGTPFNPTNHTSPFFQVWDMRFLDILGPNPSVKIIAERDDFAFAHEAPIWDPASDRVFFASNDGGKLGMSDLNHNNQVSFINLKDVKGSDPQNITFTKVPISPDVQMVNGGTPYKDNLLFISSGRGNSPPGLSLVNPNPPFNSTTILDNLHGRQFNSLNDAKVHPKSGAIFFTDVVYGFINNFRPAPLLPNQVYRFDPATSQLRVVADGIDKCNGIAFSPDGNIAYVWCILFIKIGNCLAYHSSSYGFDVDPVTETFLNRRVLAYMDTGAPDGVQVDSKGNVYASCGDGVQVYDPSGLLLGKVFINTVTANLVFAGKGRLVILAETKIFLVEFAAASSIVELY
ncbi:calcium-dependent phosphotriesterase [Hysterangium stoloniferum]|nr:calcium-dependent phosphotriesterase [Hysterangium stoloniferum]